MKGDQEKKSIRPGFKESLKFLLWPWLGFMTLGGVLFVAGPSITNHLVNQTPGSCRTLPLEKRIVLRPVSEERLNGLAISFDTEGIMQYEGYLQPREECRDFYEDPNLSQSVDAEIKPQILENPLAHMNETGNPAIYIDGVWTPLSSFYGITDFQQEILKRKVRYAPMSGSTK